MNITTETVLALLQQQQGCDQGLTVAEIVETITLQRSKASNERQVREVIAILRRRGHPICAHPSSGYFWATSPAELHKSLAFLHARAMSSLIQISRLKRLAIPTLAGQLALPIGNSDEPALGYLYRQPDPNTVISLELELTEVLYQAAKQMAEANGFLSVNQLMTFLLETTTLSTEQHNQN